jgi:Protein of unknown function (DUF3168)
MATTEAALVSLLVQGSPNPVADLVGTRVYPLRLPQQTPSTTPPVLPAIRYQRIDTVRAPYREMATGRSEYVRPRFQIDCYATTPAGAQQVADAVRAQIDGFRGVSAGVTIGGIALEDEGADLEEGVGVGGAPIYRHRLDFLIGHAEI